MRNKFYFGVDYYPEQWPQDRWVEDFQLMQAGGVNVIRLAEFSWSKLEPQNGHFNFDWLDKVLELCVQFSIEVVLGTPTASPPAWLMNLHPEFFSFRSRWRSEEFWFSKKYLSWKCVVPRLLCPDNK